MCQKDKPDDDVNELVRPSKIERAMSAALERTEDADIYVLELVAEAVRDAEVARARAAVRVPPGIDGLMARLREKYPDAKHIDVGEERARMEQMLEDSPNALPLKEPESSQVVFIHSKAHLAAVKRALGRDTQDEREETP